MIILTIVTSCTILGVGCCAILAILPKPPPRTPPSYQQPRSSDGMVTYENYLLVETGMSYEEVASILGEGAESSRTDMAGNEVVTYQWQGEWGKDKTFYVVTIGFLNGKVQNKNQIGLEPD